MEERLPVLLLMMCIRIIGGFANRSGGIVLFLGTSRTGVCTATVKVKLTDYWSNAEWLVEKMNNFTIEQELFAETTAARNFPP